MKAGDQFKAPAGKALERHMGKLADSTRKTMPASEFGLPGSRKYPISDPSHAANAKARATQMVNAGKLSPADKAKIDRKANAMLKK